MINFGHLTGLEIVGIISIQVRFFEKMLRGFVMGKWVRDMTVEQTNEIL